MNNEQQELLDEAYKNYEKNAVVGDVVDSHYVPATDKWNLYIKEEFIGKIKIDDRFAKKWGLKIEERELSEEERYDLCAAQKSKMTAISEEDYIKYNIPTKLITITYNDKTIESYE
jgi:hypothetical protein